MNIGRLHSGGCGNVSARTRGAKTEAPLTYVYASAFAFIPQNSAAFANYTFRSSCHGTHFSNYHQSIWSRALSPCVKLAHGLVAQVGAEYTCDAQGINVHILKRRRDTQVRVVIRPENGSQSRSELINFDSSLLVSYIYPDAASQDHVSEHSLRVAGFDYT